MYFCNDLQHPLIILIDMILMGGTLDDTCLDICPFDPDYSFSYE